MSLMEYLHNTRELLRLDPHKFGLTIERQVQFRVLPRIAGSRAALEPQLWELLVFCLDGHESKAPAFDDAAYAEKSAERRRVRAITYSTNAAAYPKAAAAVLAAISTLREVGRLSRSSLLNNVFAGLRSYRTLPGTSQKVGAYVPRSPLWCSGTRSSTPLSRVDCWRKREGWDF
ncbi:MAG: hypothetical protein R3C68_10555 [Myxococcota bacterium]